MQWQTCTIINTGTWHQMTFLGEEVVQVFEDQRGNMERIRAFSLQASPNRRHQIYYHAATGLEVTRDVSYADEGGPWQEDVTLGEVTLELVKETARLIARMMDEGWVLEDTYTTRRQPDRKTVVETVCKLRYSPAEAHRLRYARSRPA